MKRLIVLLTIGTIIELSMLTVIGAAESTAVTSPQSSWNIVKVLFPNPTTTPSPTPTPTPTPTPAFNRPDRIEITPINLNAPIEEIAIDSAGNMGVPQSFGSVGWFALGTKIGWQGNAVLTGHYDDIYGRPAAFYNLHKIPVGSDITLTDDTGRTLRYVVERSESRPVGNWSLTEIFGPTDERRLNLITCSGWWNPKIRNYTHRHIVFSRLASE